MLIELTTKLNFETNTPPVEAMAPDCSNSDHQPIDDDEDIVITGMSGRYPSCANLEEFWNGLVAGRELAEINDKRWPIGKCYESKSIDILFWVPFDRIFRSAQEARSDP